MSSEQAEKPVENGENEAEVKTETEPATPPNAEITKSANADEESKDENKVNDETVQTRSAENEKEPDVSEHKVEDAESKQNEDSVPSEEKTSKIETETQANDKILTESEKPEESKLEEPSKEPEESAAPKVAEPEKVSQTPDKVQEEAKESDEKAEKNDEPKASEQEKVPEESKEDETAAKPEEKQNGAVEGAVGGTEVDPKNLNGKYSHVKSTNVDNLFKSLGLPWMLRKIASQFNPTTDIVQDGDKFDIKLVTGFKTKEWKFTLGEEFEDKPMNWNSEPVIVNSSWEDDKLVMISKPKNETSKVKTMRITRQLIGEELTMVLEHDDVVCTRVFKKKK